MPAAAMAPAEAGSVKALRALLGVLTVLFVLAALLYEIGPLLQRTRDFFQQLPFVSNSVVKVGILLCCCLYARGNLRDRRGLVVIVIVAHIVSVVAMGVLLVGMTIEPQLRKVLFSAIALDGVITALLVALYLRANAALPAPTPPRRRRRRRRKRSRRISPRPSNGSGGY